MSHVPLHRTPGFIKEKSVLVEVKLMTSFSPNHTINKTHKSKIDFLVTLRSRSGNRLVQKANFCQP